MSQGLRRRLPDLLIEAAFVFFAVIVALAAEEWREGRERDMLADRALEGVLHEMRENQTKLLRDQDRNEEDLAQLSAALREMAAGGQPDDVSINYQVALTSTAAWETARLSQAVHFMNIDVMSDLAEVYELQSLFERAQDEIVDEVAGLSLGADDESRTLGQVEARMRAVLGYRDVLIQSLGGALTRHGGGTDESD